MNENVTKPAVASKIFSKNTAQETTRRYELRLAIWLEIGVVISPGMAETAIDVAAAAAVSSTTIICFLSSVSIIGALTLGDEAIFEIKENESTAIKRKMIAVRISFLYMRICSFRVMRVFYHITQNSAIICWILWKILHLCATDF